MDDAHVEGVRSVAIGGFMGVGKSTTGRLLATALGLPFVDTDDLLVERFGPIDDQIRSEGEEIFRAREREVIAGLDDGHPRVIATGGGAWADPVNRGRLRRHAALVVLTAPLEVLEQRVAAVPGTRPLWDRRVRARYEARRAAYEDADLIVDTSTRPPGVVATEILRWLRSTR